MEDIKDINLDLLPKEGDRLLKELGEGHMVIARSKNDFLYIVEADGMFHMFSHTPGAQGGGQRQFPKNEKYTASVRKIADISDAVYMAEYDKGLNIYGVMSSAEEGILSMFPGEDRDSDETVEFIIPDKSGKAEEAE